MSKLVVTANSMEHLNELLDKKIDGILLAIDDLSVNASFYLKIDMLDKIDFRDKEVFISLNKLMHNSDLELLRNVMKILKDIDVKIIFYDMAVYNIAKEYGMIDKLVIGQDHLNASVLSNKFYHDLGILNSYVTMDITKDELLEIKSKSNMNIMFMGYGYAPIFYSRRYLISNYLEYIGDDDKYDDYEIISDTGISYPIDEEKYGTTVYSPRVINLINYLDEMEKIDYLVLNSNKINNIEFNNMVDKFIKHEKMEDTYCGFFNTKTIYKVK